MAPARVRRVQPVVVAVARRSAALWLDAVLSHAGASRAVPPVSSKIYQRLLLDHCGGVLRSRQGVRIYGCSNLFGRGDPERAYAQASGGSGGLLGDLAIFR